MDLAAKMIQKPQFVSPANVLAEIGVKSGMNVVDYASGAGHWSIAAAKLVAPKGKVLAIENNINMLNLVRSKAEIENISNIEIEELELEKGTSKMAKPSDLVIVSNILHLIRDKGAFAVKAVNMLGPRGRLLFVDWSPVETLFGPPLDMRISEEQVITIFEKAGLRFAHTVNAGIDHFGLVFYQLGENDGKTDSTTK